VQDPLLLSLNGFKNLATQFKNQHNSPTQYANFILETQMSGMDVPAQRQIQAQIKATFAEQNNLTAQAYQLHR
jgi:hypothetical protein